ncbi:hypothetical protein DVH24_040376 [Malus domestica]|uniref:Uncharacterized protein n=1 Tax=Malus domestica TaxID=3750 RepID=A0A498I8K3_MALDO|nr:hypothetical protein DVH24_040376 [Malus domestica]
MGPQHLTRFFEPGSSGKPSCGCAVGGGDPEVILTLLSEIGTPEGGVVTEREWPESKVGILVPGGRDLRVWRGRGRGQKWYWSRERAGGVRRSEDGKRGGLRDEGLGDELKSHRHGDVAGIREDFGGILDGLGREGG